MRFITRYPLRIMIPFFLLMAGIIISVYSMIHSSRVADTEAENSGMTFVTQDMSQLQGNINHALQEGDVEEIKDAIANRGSNTNVDLVLMADENNIVLHATRVECLGLPIQQAVPDIDTDLINNAKKTMSGKTTISKNRDSISAYYPVVIGARQDELRPSRVGILFIKYDLTYLKAARRYAIEHQAWRSVSLYSLLFLSLGIILYYALTKRLLGLVAAAKRFAAGDTSARSGLQGKDEIAQIGEAFDSMVQKILIDQEALRESEERYRSLFEEAQDGIALADAETGEIVDCNQSLCRMTEKDKTELLGQPQSILHPQHQLINGLSSSFRLHKIKEPGLTLEDNLLSKSGKMIPVEIRASRLRMNGRDYLLGIFRDITQRKNDEKQLLSTVESLRKAVGTTIQILVNTVEARDPYTAGHQIRSADLARAIATEMGLPQNTVEGIRMAGSIHDIGKISIPAEILSKPTKLSELEFSLIKEHAQKGYEMLKDVESPWPLAEIVRQHHERMDGSGYPRNLKGEEILIEARILCVADVVEAMASDRPYRPGLGIDAALNEIEKNRGIFYDVAVADACLRLFREKGFKLEGT